MAAASLPGDAGICTHVRVGARTPIHATLRVCALCRAPAYTAPPSRLHCAYQNGNIHKRTCWYCVRTVVLRRGDERGGGG
jgi:hypothetical protein